MAVPSKIRCYVCYQVKGPVDFSNNQLEKLQTALKKKQFNTITNTIIKCWICADTRQYCKQCSTCDKWKGADAFSRAQRNMDDGDCRRCIDTRDNPEPVDEEIEAMVEDDDEDNGEEETVNGTPSTSGGRKA